MTKKINLKRTIKKIMVVDTETIGSLYGNDESTKIPFDVSINIIDMKTKKVVYKKCYLIRKFINNKYTMGGSFSAGKYPWYLKQLKNKNKDFKVVSVGELFKDLARLKKKYSLKVASAYNSRFDMNKLNQLAKEFKTENTIKGLGWLDLMKVVNGIYNSDDYKKFCELHKNILVKKDNQMIPKFYTPTGKLKKTVETISCYLYNDELFKEEHTGLDDLKHELNILLASEQYNKSHIFDLVEVE